MPYKPTHANGTFTKFGAPEIDKLYNDRYRIVVRCNVKGVDSKWHYSNVENFWKDFGSLYESPLQVDGADVGWEPATGETYPNMRLIEVAQNYPRTPNDGAPVLEFIYETLTSVYTQDADDKVDHELNGLRRVTRTVIATEDSSYAKVVGTDTIDHTGRGYGSETLTLASAEEVPKRQNEGGFTRIQEIWVASGTLSETLDNVGSQKAKVIETIGADPATPSGYSLASKQESNFEGLQTNRFTFLKPSILSLKQELSGGSKQVSVQAFGLDEADVIAALSEVTADHVLLSQSESDYAGIKTTTFEFRLDESFTEDYELNGLQRISLVELSVSNFTAQTIGSVSSSAPTTGLYLGTQKIENGGSIKVRESVWLEPGELSRDIRSVGRGVQQTTHQFLITEGTTVGDVISRDIDDFEGLKRITVSVIAKPDGSTLTESDGSEKLNYSYQSLVPFTFPGVVDLQNEQGHIFPAVRSPVQANVKADIYTFYQTSDEIVSGDFTKELDSQTSLGLWNPSEWCQKISTISSSGNNPAYFNAQGLRGCRTRESFTLSGSLQESLSANLQYLSLGRGFQISDLVLEETTDLENGKSVFRQVIRYTSDVTSKVSILPSGVVVLGGDLTASGLFTIEVKWDGSQWTLTGTNVVTDPQPTAAADPGGTGNTTVFVYSAAANLGQGGYLAGYTNQGGSQPSVSFTASGGGTDPWDATWPAGVTVTEPSNEEEFSSSSAPSASFDAGSIASNFSFIEGRVVALGAVGRIKISGGPPNPLGKVYTLDVELEKVFTKIDGTDVYRKTIVIANCTPA